MEEFFAVQPPLAAIWSDKSIRLALGCLMIATSMLSCPLALILVIFNAFLHRNFGKVPQLNNSFTVVADHHRLQLVQGNAP